MLTLDNLTVGLYASIVCYPRLEKLELRKRLRELEELRIDAVEFVGEKRAFNIPVLGKGCTSIVILARRKSEKVALKIRRTDASRPRMQREARLLEKANLVNVGPKLLGASRNFLVMEYIEGVALPEWIENTRFKTHVRKALREALEQCWRLDQIGLDHGELSHAPKHVIIDKESLPFIVDFESSSLKRRPSNVTSMCQFLFIGSETARKVARKLGERDKEKLVETLRRYKKRGARQDFVEVLTACKL